MNITCDAIVREIDKERTWAAAQQLTWPTPQASRLRQKLHIEIDRAADGERETWIAAAVVPLIASALGYYLIVMPLARPLSAVEAVAAIGAICGLIWVGSKLGKPSAVARLQRHYSRHLEL